MKSLSVKLGAFLVIGLAIFTYGEVWGANITPLPPIYGTAIAALITEDEIAVAADSGATGEGGVTKDVLLCKIRPIDNIFVAVHGMIEYTSPGGLLSGFDLWRIISNTARGNQKISVKADSFESLLKPELESAINLMKIFNISDYYRYFPISGPKRPVVGAIFIGIEDGDLVMSHRGFSANTTEKLITWLEPDKVDYVGTLCSVPCHIFVSDNKKEENDEFEKANLSAPLKESLTDIARKFVQMSIDKNSPKFKPPIDIISITHFGPCWIKRKEECREFEK
jgi:hypothetical protein